MSQYDVLGIGNAIVDVIAETSDAFLIAEKIPKGSMQLIDQATAERLYSKMEKASIISGGSAANTIVGLASLGGKAAFIGKVKTDAVGDVFAKDIQASGVSYHTKKASAGAATARSFIFVTPDAERTMNTYLGASQALSVDDIDAELIAKSGVTYLEGYLWDPPAAKLAFRKAAEIAHQAGQRVALTLSDTFCVDRYRAEFRDLIKSRAVDLVFANKAELCALYETQDFAAAREAIRADAIEAVVTNSEDGAIVMKGAATEIVPASPIKALVDTTGAGDLFAAGYLYGYTHNLGLRRSAELGALAAAHIIQKIGARPAVNLAELARAHKLL